MAEMTLERLTDIVRFLDEHDVGELYRRVEHLEKRNQVLYDVQNRLEQVERDLKDLLSHQDATDRRIGRLSDEVSDIDIAVQRVKDDVFHLERKVDL